MGVNGVVAAVAIGMQKQKRYLQHADDVLPAAHSCSAYNLGGYYNSHLFFHW